MEQRLKTYKAKPQARISDIGHTARILKFELEQNSEIDRVFSIQNLLVQLQVDLQNSSYHIQNIAQEKSKLKHALSNTLKKKDELYQQAKYWYSQLNQSNQQLSTTSAKLQKAKQKLHLLYQSFKKKEQQLFEYQRKQRKLAPLSPDLISKVWQLTAKANQSQESRLVFNQHFSDQNQLRTILQKGSQGELANKVLDFSIDLVKTISDSYQFRIAKLGRPFKVSHDMLDALPKQMERVTKLNQEMISTMERSKQILSSPISPKDRSLRSVPSKQNILDTKLDSAESKFTFNQVSSENLLMETGLEQRGSFSMKRKLSPKFQTTKIPKPGQSNTNRGLLNPIKKGSKKLK